MKLDDIHRLLYNPSWTGKMLNFFLSGASASKSGKIKFELLYLAFPFLYDELILDRLISSNSRTTLSGLLKHENIKIKLVGMPSKVEAFREVTNKAIVSTGNQIEFCEGGYVRTTKILDYTKDKGMSEIRPYFKAAQNLGLILAKEDSIEALLKTGI